MVRGQHRECDPASVVERKRHTFLQPWSIYRCFQKVEYDRNRHNDQGVKGKEETSFDFVERLDCNLLKNRGETDSV